MFLLNGHTPVVLNPDIMLHIVIAEYHALENIFEKSYRVICLQGLLHMNS